MKQFIYLFSGLLLLFASTPRVVAQEIGDYSQLNDEDYSKIDLPPLSVLFENAKNNPVTKPDHRPLFNVRCIHNIPIGPIGADTNMPMAKPRIIVYSVKSIKSKNYLILLKYGINHKIV